MTCAGTLRKFITIESLTTSQGSGGGVEESFSTFATVWADRKTIRGREFFDAQQLRAEASVNFVIRFRTDIVTTMRISHDGRLYDILSAEDPDGRKEEIHILSRERV